MAGLLAAGYGARDHILELIDGLSQQRPLSSSTPPVAVTARPPTLAARSVADPQPAIAAVVTETPLAEKPAENVLAMNPIAAGLGAAASTQSSAGEQPIMESPPHRQPPAVNNTVHSAKTHNEPVIIVRHTPTPRELAEQHYQTALQLLDQERPTEAEIKLRQALLSMPEHHLARHQLATLLINQQQLQMAQEILSDGMAIAPENTSYCQLLARVLMERNQIANAVLILEKNLHYAPRNADYLALLATAYQRNSQHKEAIQAYAKALYKKPLEGKWWLGKAISLEATKNWGNALRAYDSALANGLEQNLSSYATQRKALVETKLTEKPD
ncbi:MAG: hypothetical protein HY940_04435 [Gammaproteobacteria bacterium]|nr:hypothetical protein [Gammaproteobacteria bacterium]